MPDEIWRLPEDAKAAARESGYTPEQIEVAEAARRANWNAIKEATRGDVSDEDWPTFYMDKYGIDHVCRCAEDKFTGNFIRVTECMGHFLPLLLEAYETVLPERDELRSAVDVLRMQVAELGGTPRA